MKQPIAFFSEGVKDYEGRYSYIEKQVLAIIRALKNFRHLLSKNKVKLLVSHASVRNFLLCKDINEKRARWITKVMEYDVDIKITNLVRGKGLCEQMVSSLDAHNETALLLQD